MKIFLPNSHALNWLSVGAIGLLAGIVVALMSTNFFSPSPVETKGHMIVLQSEAAPQLGLVLDNKLRVVYVVKGGAADSAGIKKGDILKKVNKLQINNSSGARKAFNQLQSKRVLLIVQRGSKELNFDVTPLPPDGIDGAPTPTAVPPDMLYF